MSKKNRAFFLDRDGTINRDVGYPGSYRAIEIYRYSFDAVKRINSAGFLAVVITNQSGIGRGLIKEESLLEIHKKMREEFYTHGARLDGFYYCPHYIHSHIPSYKIDCSCRKPNPEMGLRAARDFNIDLSESYMIGDKVEDILFGHNIGAQPILVLTGYGRESLVKLKESRIPFSFKAETLLDAVDWAVAKDRGPGKLEK